MLTCFKCGTVGHIATNWTKNKRGCRPTSGTWGATAEQGTPFRKWQQNAPSASSTTPERQTSESPPPPERGTPNAPKPEPDPIPDMTEDPTSTAEHEADCQCMLCSLVKRLKGQEPSLATWTAAPPPPPEAAQNHDESSTKKAKPHEASSMNLWALGKSALASGRTTQAIHFFDQCIAKDPNAAAFFVSRADAYVSLRKYAAALGDFQCAHGLLKTASPKTAAVPVLVKLACCLLYLGSHGPALLATQEALSVEPGDTAALALKKRLSAIENGVAAYQTAKACRQLKTAKAAYDACANAYTEDGGVLPVVVSCWEVELQIAEAKWTEALAVSSVILATHLKSIKALLMRALVLFLTADLGEALNKINTALRLDPDHEEVKAARARFKNVSDLKEDGNFRFKTGDLSGAIEQWTSALNVSLRVSPNHWQSDWWLTCLIHIQLVAEKEAEGSGGRIRALLLLNRSRARLKIGHPDALKDVNAAGKLDPHNVKIIVTRGRIFIGLKLFESAIQEFKAALQADATKLSAADRLTVQSELGDAEQHAVLERNKIKDWYEILDIERDCTTEEIRRAYRTQCLKHHPDKGGVPEKFRMITEAYDTLSDPIERYLYDASA
ncbi:uncharacterized protein C8Q71DRAFT_905633 [Rhodofomes roseus]|uniref:J domain-containing protein n=1 Tax=Rhodofomes roseus TaxID=34475 RepID=A0ABQ8KLB9_9APHY|nr:uncharacterized protein C8Q71DRAFT_905633 [Rhodofomes roseus]KAH9839006.1 hypothetical protein C8Q71DRAFT_905633 [Rhodofomes roseus]